MSSDSCPSTAPGGELPFNVFADRYERCSTIVISNLALSEWVRAFDEGRRLENLSAGGE